MRHLLAMLLRPRERLSGIGVGSMGTKATKIRVERVGSKTKRNPVTLPARVRINPRTGKTQIFVTPQVASKLSGVKGIKLATLRPSTL